jgi:hypothetical protein
MNHHLLVDAEGWVQGTRVTEGPQPPVTATAVPVTPDIIHVARTIPMLRHQGGELELPQDDRVAWRLWRAHGLSGSEAHAALELVRQARTIIPRDLTAVPKKLPRVQQWPGMPVGLVADVPGLEIIPMTHEHLDSAAQIAIDYNIYLAQCPGDTCQCQPSSAHSWLMLAQRIDNEDTWQMALMFNGVPLQFELVNIVGDTATFSLTYHMNRERPHWFWREAEQPVFAALKAMGVKRIQSRTRADRPDWIQALKENYGAVEMGEWDAQTKKLEYPLTMTTFRGWPARKLSGFDMTTGPIRTWEAVEEDLPAVRTLADQIPGAQGRIARRMIDEWWYLDRATILLGSRNGVLRYARALRQSRSTVAAIGTFSALFDEPGQGVMAGHVKDWARQAGYTTIRSLFPTRLMSSSRVQAQITKSGARVVGQRMQYLEPFTEIITDL